MFRAADAKSCCAEEGKYGVVDRLEKSIERLRNPAPGSRIDVARDFGVDLNLLIANLRLTPAECVRRMHAACVSAEQIRGIARGRKS